MKTGRRVSNSGQSLMSQGEPMVWLTGGMFAVACLMIFSLIALILYQGLATHWQRSYEIYPLTNGELIGGELIARQHSSQSKDGENKSDDSNKLYLRTGNYDLTNQHFLFVPEKNVLKNGKWQPNDLWLLERREWGVLYGFPIQLEQSESPEFDEAYRERAALIGQLNLLANEENKESLEQLRGELHAFSINRRYRNQNRKTMFRPSTRKMRCSRACGLRFRD